VSLLKLIYKDYRRYRDDTSCFETIFLTQGFWATCVYRLSRYTYENINNKIIRKPGMFICGMLGKFIEIVTGIYIPIQCEIGEGLKIHHFGTIFFATGGRLGRNCSVSHGTTMGFAGQGEERGTPVLGDRVYVGPHAIILGKITIGDDALISPGAVVLRSVPPRAVVLGNPARVVSYDGSFEIIKYDGMEADVERIASLNCPRLNQVNRGPATQDAPDRIGMGDRI